MPPTCNSTLPGTPGLAASWTLGIVEAFPQALGASGMHSEFARFFHLGQDGVHFTAGIGPGRWGRCS